jgi:hypothetical protein
MTVYNFGKRSDPFSYVELRLSISYGRFGIKLPLPVPCIKFVNFFITETCKFMDLHVNLLHIRISKQPYSNETG